MPRIDDRHHPALRRGRRPAQLAIDALADGPGRARYGNTEVQETEARSALTDFSMGGHQRGVAWSVNPYTGCQHQCSYCYVPDTIHAQRERWGHYVIAKRNLPTVLMRETRRRPARPTYLSTATDPYQPVEQEHGITRRCLQVLARRRWPVDILTRSPLVLRDLDVLHDIPSLRVGLSVPTLDDALRRVLEPSAPPVEARLDTLRRLADAGLRVHANHAPAFPFTGDATPAETAEAFQDAGVEWINTSPWRYLQSILPVLRARLAAAGREDLLPMIADDQRQRRLHNTLRHACERIGLPLRTGFYNPFTDDPGPWRLHAPDTPAATGASPSGPATGPAAPAP